MTLGKLRQAGWDVALLILVAYAARTWLTDVRGAITVIGGAIRNVVAGGALLGSAPLHPWTEAAVTVGVIAVWIGLTVVAPRDRLVDALSLGGRLTAATAIVALAGIAILLVIGIGVIAPIQIPGLLLVATAVTILATALVLGWQAGASEPVAPPADPFGLRPLGPPSGAPTASATAIGAAALDAQPVGAEPLRSWAWRALQLVAIAALALLGWALGRDIVHLALFRPEASGDEAYFWWRATSELHRLGFQAYMTSFDVAGYPAGYPLLGNLLLGWLPAGVFDAAGRALPFLYAFLGLRVLTNHAITPRRLISPVAAIYGLLAYLLLFHLSWVHEMLWKLWYGEALAIVTVTLLFLVVDAARSVDDPHAAGSPAPVPPAQLGSNPGRNVVLTLFGFAAGALGVVVKPPLSFLLVPAVVPTLLVTGLLVRRRGEPIRPLVACLGSIALGGIAAQVAWATLLRASGQGAYYSVDVGALLAFDPGGSFSKLVPYFVANYQPVIVAFALTSILALLHDWRRFVPYWLVAVGLIGSIFMLYLGPWHEVEHESGARYILHGAYGWTLFALGAMAPAVAERLRSWTAAVRVANVRRQVNAFGRRLRIGAPGW